MSLLSQILQGFNGNNKLSDVYAVYMIPLSIINWDNTMPMQFAGQTSPKVIDVEVDKPTAIDSYVPKNNKLFTYPYSCLEINNNNGTSNILKYEFFSGNKATFKIKGVPTLGGSIKLIPYTYNKYVENEEEGIIAGKFPTLNWSENEYLNWQTQEGVNLVQGLQTAGVQTALGIGGMLLGSETTGATLTGQGIGGAVATLMNHVAKKQVAEMLPTTARGNTNGGNINVCNQKNGFTFINKTIKKEFAEIIDKFFTVKGYQVNEIKTPNINSRTYFNYLQISGDSVLGFGDIPEKYMQEINKIAQNGVTIWHNHTNIGNYSLDNTIVQNN